MPQFSTGQLLLEDKLKQARCGNTQGEYVVSRRLDIWNMEEIPWKKFHTQSK